MVWFNKLINKYSVFYLFFWISTYAVAQHGITMPVANTIKVDKSDTENEIILKAAHVVPNPNQLDALKDGYIAFVHFGPNTFTSKEWGTGMEDPKVFNLKNLDTDQWCRVMKEAGMVRVIITAKHHDGFVLWQSRYTDHGIMSSPYKNGKGDILKELSESCRKYGLKLGVYLSPGDLYQIENPEGLYGNQSKYSWRSIPRKIEGRPFDNKTTFNFKVDDYNEYFLNQLYELLTEYGPIHEVWFDGAHPKRKGGQKYNYHAWKELIHTLAPEAVIFGKEDLRWVGNESGGTRETEWNVIPYKGNPEELIMFNDLTDDILGSREQLYNAEYLHYQPAEVNTSIREGWFYRHENRQKVRSADDIFDIYERAVGGNAIFLLNIPPNREGLFSPEDVRVLKDAGERIKQTYNQNLLAGAKEQEEVLDKDLQTFVLLEGDKKKLEFRLNSKIKINRFLIQEAVATHGERVEAHFLEAWVNGKWQRIAESTNIGFKRILRFPEVSSNRFRLSLPLTRYIPAIATVSAHYYEGRPPQLRITRDLQGMVSIEVKKDEFSWKPHDQGKTKTSDELKIKYTKGSDTALKSYTEPFYLKDGKVKAFSVYKNQKGSVNIGEFGLLKKNWKILASSAASKNNSPDKSIDAEPESIWISDNTNNKHFLSIDLGSQHLIDSFIYTPPTKNSKGMIQKGIIKISENGDDWQKIEEFEFGNLINDPSTRTHFFYQPVNTRYIKIEVREIAGNDQTASAAEIGFSIVND